MDVSEKALRCREKSTCVGDSGSLYKALSAFCSSTAERCYTRINPFINLHVMFLTHFKMNSYFLINQNTIFVSVVAK